MSEKANTIIPSTYNKKRSTFVYISNRIRDGVGSSLWQGILIKMRELDANLICYVGGGMGEDNTTLIYNLINKDQADGIICWDAARTDEYFSFFDQFKGHPFIAISVPIPGFPVVMADSYQGMKEMIEHLVKEHSYTKIALVRGPENHVYADQRYSAYIEVLTKYNIYNEKLVTPPLDWTAADGLEGIKILLDERKLVPGKDIEAVVFVSDAPAIAGFDELTHRKIDIPDQLAVTGFNATQEALCTASPITNVTMPFFEQGRTAVDLLLKQLKKEAVPMKTVLPAKLLKAQSCGCQSVLIKNAGADIKNIRPSEDIKKPGIFSKSSKDNKELISRENITKAIFSEINKYIQNNERIRTFTAEFLAVLPEVFFNEIENNKQGEFLLYFSKLVRKLLIYEIEISFLQDIISIFRRNIFYYTNDICTMHNAEDILSQARIMIFEASSRAKDKETMIKIKQENTLRDISVRLITHYDIQVLMDILAESLPKLGIPGCYISLYENPESIKSFYDLPEKSKLILAFENGIRKKISTEGIIYKSKDLIPEGISTDSGQKTTVVYPLNFGSIQIGFVAFEMGPQEGPLYYILSYLLSTAIYGVLLKQKSDNMNDLLQKTLNNVHHKSKVVSQQSDSISRNVHDISASMEEVAASVREMSKNISHVMIKVKEAVGTANGANTEIMDLTKKSQKIGDITKIILDITEQTKILALNAAIEAVRAGEKGKGFSVVAAEVSILAKRTVSATNEITSMINTIQSQTGETAGAITHVVDTIDIVSDLSINITSAISQQVAVTNEISSLLITAAQGSKEIYEAISELANLAVTNENGI